MSGLETFSAPANWQVASLEDVADRRSPICYGIIQVGPDVYGGVPVVAIRDLNRIAVERLHRVAPAVEHRYGRSRVTDGDILISVKGTTGRIGIVPANFKGNISRDVARIRLDSRQHKPKFWFQLLRSQYAQAVLEMATVGSTRQELSIEVLKRLRFAFPPLAEQRRIAEMLSAADRQIAAIERLITKKEAIKQGLMQQLLTGRMRLPGYTARWEDKKLQDVATIDPDTISGVPSTYEIDYIALEDVSRGDILASRRVEFGQAPSRARRRLESGDVLFGTVRPNLQSHALYEGGLKRPVASTGFAVIRAMAQHAMPEFLVEFVLSDLALRQTERIIAGSNYPALSSRDVRQLEIRLPDPEEQRAIAGALGDAGSEIRLLRERLAKSKAIKQGLMQELLTGRTRLLEEPSLEEAA